MRDVLRKIAACALCVCLTQPAAAQIYKWVDANGVTHYGERPQAGSKPKEVELRGNTPAQPGNASPPAAGSDLKERELDFRKRKVARDEEEARAAQAKAQRDEYCRRERVRMAELNEIGRLFVRDAQGERVFLSDAQRDAAVARREAEFKKNCG